MPDIITASFDSVTPMFLGDADQKGTSLRPPSVKGALRFWWRALHWKDFAKAGRSGEEALRRLHQCEAQLFGAAADDREGRVCGQGRFLLTVTPHDAPAPKWSNFPSDGHKYLLGQGLFKPDQGGHLSRSFLPLSGFNAKLVFKRGTSETDCRSVAEALLVWGLLGGLGSRVRKGFGSVAIQELSGCNGLNVPQNEPELRAILTSLLRDLPTNEPPFTAFSTLTRIDISLTGSDALKLLSDVGDQMQFYRSNGRGGVVRSQPRVIKTELNFQTDHDLALQAAQGSEVATHPKRAVFGLPHNYYFSSAPAGLKKLDVNGGGRERDRRASPLLIHAHRFPDGACVVVQSLLPAQFLPDGDTIVLKGANRTQGFPACVDWQILHTYLDRFGVTPGAKKVIG